MRLIIISGHSGSGKSTALHVLEDAGFTCVDNLPASLLPALVKNVENLPATGEQKYAISIDARNNWQDLKDFPEIIRSDPQLGMKCEVIFLDARTSVLIQRFSETRRRHPLSNKSTDLQAAIEKERRLLEPIADMADLTIDTSNLSLHDLRDLIKRQVADNSGTGMAVLFESFGFKYGVPVDAEILFDARCLPNPYWKPHLRNFTGLDKPVAEFLEQQHLVPEMLKDITAYLDKWLPHFEANNRSYITVAIGCTGGQHRSVYMIEQLYKHFASILPNVQVRHRELKGNGPSAEPTVASQQAEASNATDAK